MSKKLIKQNLEMAIQLLKNVLELSGADTELPEFPLYRANFAFPKPNIPAMPEVYSKKPKTVSEITDDALKNISKEYRPRNGGGTILGERSKKQKGSRQWTEAEHALLEEAFDSGQVNFKELTELFGRTRKAIVNRLSQIRVERAKAEGKYKK